MSITISIYIFSWFKYFNACFVVLQIILSHPEARALVENHSSIAIHLSLSTWKSNTLNSFWSENCSFVPAGIHHVVALVCVEWGSISYPWWLVVALSRCRRFLNQLLTCVAVSPVAAAKSRFSLGEGYGFLPYHSLNKLRDFSCEQRMQTKALEISPKRKQDHFETIW